MLVGVVMVLLASFQPWGASGSRQRSSYALVAVADRLGFISPGLFTALARSWFAVPLGVVAAVWLVLTGRILLSAAVSAVVGCGSLAMARTVDRSPLLALNGASLGRAGGMIAVLASVLTVMVSPTVNLRKDLNDRTTTPAAPQLGRARGRLGPSAVVQRQRAGGANGSYRPDATVATTIGAVARRG
ncbi:MAG: hypothetical protein JWL70_3159 [Acidimicrobiia bacterium]|nr:hypothetical protein [Acidimicrobiia bacterium]